jgi:hypothetical protein
VKGTGKYRLSVLPDDGPEEGEGGADIWQVLRVEALRMGTSGAGKIMEPKPMRTDMPE